jgi:hypothetical protein
MRRVKCQRRCRPNIENTKPILSQPIFGGKRQDTFGENTQNTKQVLNRFLPQQTLPSFFTGKAPVNLNSLLPHQHPPQKSRPIRGEWVIERANG